MLENLSEAHFGEKFKLVKKSVEVEWRFPQSGLHSDVLQEIAFRESQRMKLFR